MEWDVMVNIKSLVEEQETDGYVDILKLLQVSVIADFSSWQIIQQLYKMKMVVALNVAVFALLALFCAPSLASRLYFIAKRQPRTSVSLR